MWNIFDTTFVVITALYIILRWKGLSTGDSELYQSLLYLWQSTSSGWVHSVYV